MNTPYTDAPLDALLAAQASTAAVLTAVVWFRPLRPRLASGLMLAAIWIAALFPMLPAFGRSFLTDPGAPLAWLKATTLLATVALLVSRTKWPVLVLAVAGDVALWKLCGFIEASGWELAAAHLIWLGALLGLVQLTSPLSDPQIDRDAPPPRGSYAAHDLRVFAFAVLVASVATILVLDRQCNSGDEWANTYNADLFAHFQAYATPPPCPRMFQNWWVFFHMGRAFGQYTPGWPLFMAPFQRIGLVWLSGPFALGLTAVAVARLSRRAAAGLGSSPGQSERIVRAAGTLGALSATLGVSMVLNAASRFPHTMVCACFAWAVECAAAVATPGISRRAQWLWGLGLGTSSVLLISARPAEATLGVGIAIYFVYALARRRIGLRALAGALVGGAFWGGLSLVILRLQVGTWFTTGYSLAPLYTGFTFSMSWPKPNEFKYGIPIATGSYCWWPCAPALAAAGLVGILRAPGRRVACMLAAGAFALLALYNMVEFGRYWDSAYGPRYHLPLVVTMAVGGAVLVAPLWVRARGQATTDAMRAAGPWVLAAAAMIAGVVRVAPLLYPMAHAEIRQRTGPLRAIAEAKLKNAIVTVQDGEIAWVAWDLAQNLPTDKNPDVYVLVNQGEPDLTCARKAFPDRHWYRAVGKGDVVELVPR